jgi:TonB family protein
MISNSPGLHVEEPSLLNVFTFVLWTSCLFVGLFGLITENMPPADAATQPALTMDVDLVSAPVADGQDSSPASGDQAAPPESAPAPLPQAMAQIPQPGDDPPLLATRSLAASAALSSAAQLSDADIQGFLPVPEYPTEAKLAHQEGTVVIVFTVGTDGCVTDARIASGSPWPLLNESALRTVRDEYRLAPGAVRRRFRSFTFQMND